MRCGQARQGMRILKNLSLWGEVGSGLVWFGQVRSGLAGTGQVRQGEVFTIFQVRAGWGEVRHGMARRG